MKRFFRHFAFAAFGISILCLALGVAMLIWTATAMKWISYGFGAVMILSGILQIASYLTGERVGLLRKLLLISGIIAAVAGVWILLTQSLAEQIMRLTVIVMGVVLLYHGFMDCKHGLDIKCCGTGGWTAALVLGVCICAAGVLILVNPFEQESALLLAAALGFLLDGLSGLFTTVALAHGKAHAELMAGKAPVIELDPAQAAEQLPDEPESAPVPAADFKEPTPDEAAEADSPAEEK